MSSQDQVRMYTRTRSKRRMLDVDLNTVPPCDSRDQEEPSNHTRSHDRQAAQGYATMPPSIDVETLDDDVIISSPRAFAEAKNNSRRSREHTIVVDVDSAMGTAEQGDSRPAWFLDYVKAATPTEEKIATFPEAVRESADVPLRAWTPKLANYIQAMGTAEQGQFAVAMLGQVLNTMVGATGGFIQLECEHADLTRRHASVSEAHQNCPAVLAFVKSEMDRLSKKLEEAEFRASKAEEEKESAVEEEILRSTEELKAEQKKGRELAQRAFAEGHMKGSTTFVKSAECSSLFDATYANCYEEILEKLTSGLTVDGLEAELAMFKKDHDLDDPEVESPDQAEAPPVEDRPVDEAPVADVSSVPLSDTPVSP